MSPNRRLTIIALILALGLARLVLTMGESASSDAFDDPFCARALNDPESVNLEDWLKDPYGGPKRLGSLTTDEGLSLFHGLLSFGSGRILAVKPHTEKAPEPYQYAEGLVVELPGDRANRRGLFELYAKFVRREGFEPQADRDQKFLFFPCTKP